MIKNIVNDNNNNVRPVAVLGSTGSVGKQTLDVARHLGYPVKLLTAFSSDKETELQARRFNPDEVALYDEAAAKRLKTALADTPIKVTADTVDAVRDFGRKYGGGANKSGVAVNAVSGIAGLLPAIAAAEAGLRIGMANKEAIVTAGAILSDAVKRGGAELIPVDSEHSAIFQCLCGIRPEDVSRIILTASGGAFYGYSKARLAEVTAADALAHPTWKMGRKITVDSASLMNKGFEIIEAARLFGVTEDKIDVVIQRESIIHSMVETNDGAVIAQLGSPDMRTCVMYALTYPKRCAPVAERLDFKKLGSLTFGEPDTDAFPLLNLARYAVRRGGIVPAYLNAADEAAVAAFLEDKISFTDIFRVVSEITVSAPDTGEPTLGDIFAADAEAAGAAAALIEKISGR